MPSTSATRITQVSPTRQRSSGSSGSSSTVQPQHQVKSSLQPVSVRRDRQSTVIAKQRSAPDRKRETAEEAKLREAVMSEVLDIKPSERWNDIAGLAGAKQVLQSLLPCIIAAILHAQLLASAVHVSNLDRACHSTATHLDRNVRVHRHSFMPLAMLTCINAICA